MDVVAAFQEIVGAAHVLTGAERAGYATDVTGVFEGEALAVVRPASTAEVSAVVRLASAEGIAVIPQGGNTGLAGGCYGAPGRAQIILSLSRMTAIREIRPEARLAVVEAGVVLESLHRAVAQHGLIYPVTFGAKGSCTIGGNLATNAGGSNVVRYGNTRDLVLGVEAIEGTDALIERCRALARPGPGPVLVKAKKPQQERRNDLPTVGLETVRLAADCGLRGIALGAGDTFMLEPAAMTALADERGLFLHGIPPAAES